MVARKLENSNNQINDRFIFKVAFLEIFSINFKLLTIKSVKKFPRILTTICLENLSLRKIVDMSHSQFSEHCRHPERKMKTNVFRFLFSYCSTFNWNTFAFFSYSYIVSKRTKVIIHTEKMENLGHMLELLEDN